MRLRKLKESALEPVRIGDVATGSPLADVLVEDDLTMPSHLRPTLAVLALSFSLGACGREALWPQAGGSSEGERDAGTKDDGHSGKTACTFKGFANPVAYGPSASPRALVATDLTGDGRIDLLVAELAHSKPALELLANNGRGAFSLSALPSAIDPSAAVAADFNGDGLVDLVSQGNSATSWPDLATDDGMLAFDFGAGHGTLAAQALTLPTPQTNGQLAVGDFDGDGRPDLAFAGYNYIMTAGAVSPTGGIGLPGPVPTNFGLNVYRNLGQGHFAPPARYSKTEGQSDLLTGDFDGDGHVDIAELAATMTSSLGVFYNAGDGRFGNEATFGGKPDWSFFGAGVADFNGDGIDDVAAPTILRPNASDQAIVIEVFSGSPDRNFSVSTTEITAVPDVSQVAIGDFDGDGKADVALVLQPMGRGGASPPVPVAIFSGHGDGTFAAPTVYLLNGASELLTNAITAADFNGDGVTDLAVATAGRFSPYPAAVHVLLSRCE